MENRYATNPIDMKEYDTARLRQEYLVENLFNKGEIRLAHTHQDRVILGERSRPASR